MAQMPRGTWSLGRTGVWGVAGAELRRYGMFRWAVGLIAWLAVFGGLTGLYALTFRAYTPRDDTAEVAVFGFVVLLVLLFSALAGPLQSGSLNGEHAKIPRPAGLAPTPAEVVIGKLIAIWLASSSILVAGLPFLLWTWFHGGTPIGRLAVALGFIALLLLTAGAIGLGYSVLTAHTWWSFSLTFLTVLVLTVGLPEVYGLTRPLVTATESVTVDRPVPGPAGTTTCRPQTFDLDQAHTERTWWLLAASPLLAVADAAPVPSRPYDVDPLTELRTWMRDLRLGPPVIDYGCDSGTEARQTAEAEALTPSWPWSVLAQLGLIGGFAVLSVRQLRPRAAFEPDNVPISGSFTP